MRLGKSEGRVHLHCHGGERTAEVQGGQRIVSQLPFQANLSWETPPSPLPPSPASWPGPLVHQLWKVRWGSFLQTQSHPLHRHTNTQSGEGLWAGFWLSQKHPLGGWLASWDLYWDLASRSSCSWKRTRCLWAEVWGAPHAGRSSWGRTLAGVSAVY